MKKDKQNKLEQATFLMSLTEDINRYNQMFLQAWPVLTEYHEVPKEMTEEEWNRVTDAVAVSLSNSFPELLS